MRYLTNKQARFVEEYMIDLNGSQAAIRAGYSKLGPRQAGEKLLRKPNVAAAIQKAIDIRAARSELTVDMVLEELSKMALYAKKDSDKNKALELLGKHLGMFVDRKHVTGKINHDHDHVSVSAVDDLFRSFNGKQKEGDAKNALPN